MAATAAMLVGNSVRPSLADSLRKCDDVPLFTLRLKSSSGNFAARNNQSAVVRTITAAKKKKVAVEPEPEVEEVVIEEEVEVADEEEEGDSWVSERVHDVQEATQAMIEAVPGPRVGSSGMPWLVALPLGYMVLTFIVAVIRTVRKKNTPQAKRRRQVNRNATLNEELNAFFPALQGSQGGSSSEDAMAAAAGTLTVADYSKLARQFKFTPAEVLRKYLRYVINEQPFSPSTVAALLHVRRASALSDEEVVEVVNEIGRRVVKQKGPVVMDTSGFTEKGVLRKAAVQGIFTKLYYLAELDDFISPAARPKVDIKSIFGVTDEDVAAIRIVSLTSSDDLDNWEKSLTGTISEGLEGEVEDDI